MRRNTFAFLLGFFLIALLIPSKAEASTKAAGSSAALLTTKSVSPVQDNRAKILKAFLKQENSPLADSANTFVEQADKNKLDWKLVAAISGVESGFGKAYPVGTYNGWGWGIYGSNTHYFTSWDDAVATISKGLRENYINKWGAKDVYGIGRIYAADPNWAYKVTRFMDKIQAFSDNYVDDTLSISL